MRDCQRITTRLAAYEIGFATLPSEILQVQRLRYEVFTVEEGDERYAAHDAATFGDSRDEVSAVVLAVDEAGAAAATLRLSLRRDGPFICDHGYPFLSAANLLGLDPKLIQNMSAVAERGVVARPHRGGGLFAMVYDFAEAWLVKQGVFVLFGAVMDSKPEAATVQERFGYALVETNDIGQGGPWRYYAKDLRVRGVRPQ